MSRPRNVSLACELDDMLGLVQGASFTAEALINGDFANEWARRTAPRALRSTLVLLADRIKALQRAVVGERDPAFLQNPFNDAAANAAEEDLLLKAWTPEQRRRHAERELRQLDADVKRGAKR